jgi:hypothetical protein
MFTLFYTPRYSQVLGAAKSAFHLSRFDLTEFT